MDVITLGQPTTFFLVIPFFQTRLDQELGVISQPVFCMVDTGPCLVSFSVIVIIQPALGPWGSDLNVRRIPLVGPEKIDFLANKTEFVTLQIFHWSQDPQWAQEYRTKVYFYGADVWTKLCKFFIVTMRYSQCKLPKSKPHPWKRTHNSKQLFLM